MQNNWETTLFSIMLPLTLVIVYYIIDYVVSVPPEQYREIVKGIFVLVQVFRYSYFLCTPSLLAVETCVIFCRLDFGDHSPLLLCMIFAALHDPFEQ